MTHKYEMNIYCNSLRIPLSPLKNDIDIHSYKKPQEVLPLDVINPEIKDWFLSLGIEITFIEVFYRTAGNVGSIHMDGNGGNYSKINWIYGGKNSVMEWFNVKSEANNKQLETKLTAAGTPYISYNDNDVELVHSASIVGPALVQVGSLHRVKNPDEERWCLCFVLCSTLGNRLKIETASNILKDYILT